MVRWVRKWVARLVLLVVCLAVGWVLLYRWVDPWTWSYLRDERARLGEVRQVWVPLEDIAPVMRRSVVAAEDANFCLHWGFDTEALRAAIADGGARGASTITQQTVKNVFLTHDRSYTRKLLEAMLTPLVEALWSKERILEVYLNVAEFDAGVFGVGAAGPWYFGVEADALSRTQAAQLAAVLPNPKRRSARRASARARAIADGAATIARDGRAGCFGG